MAPPSPEKQETTETPTAAAPANPGKPAEDAAAAQEAKEVGDNEAAAAQEAAESALKGWPAGIDAKKQFWNAVQPILEKHEKKQPLSAEEQKIFEWADPAPTAPEEETALKRARELLAETWSKANPQVTADSIPVAREIDQLATEGKIDFRETRALNSYLADTLKKGEKVLRMSEAELKKFRQDAGLDTPEENLSFWDRAAKTLDDFVKLVEKWLGVKLAGDGLREAITGKKVEKQDRKFSSSPVGTKPLAFNRDYEVGKGVEIKSENGAPILAAEKGKVAVNGSTVTVARENGVKIVYENIVAEPGINGKDLNVGDAIGKAPENGLFTMKLSDSSGAEQKITDYLPEPTQTTIAQKTP